MPIADNRAEFGGPHSEIRAELSRLYQFSKCTKRVLIFVSNVPTGLFDLIIVLSGNDRFHVFTVINELRNAHLGFNGDKSFTYPSRPLECFDGDCFLRDIAH